MQVTDVKIVFFELEDWEEKILRKEFPSDEIIFSREKLTFSNVEKFRALEAISVFIYSEVYEDVLNNMPHLKFIATRSTGFDHIDLGVCKKKGITISNVPVYGEHTVAEQAFALILGLSRKLVDSVEKTRSYRHDTEGLRGTDLFGKTLGVVGTGHIGSHAIRMGKGFAMNVVAFDVVKDEKLAKRLGFKYVTLDELFKVSDFITLHVPYNKHTHHLVNEKRLSLMKKNSFLINTSRGGIIDSVSLAKALKSNKIAGAGLDVLEEERAFVEEIMAAKGEEWRKADKEIIKANHALLKMKNVLITPHNAANTHEAMMRILNTSIENIKQFKKGKLVNTVKT